MLYCFLDTNIFLQFQTFDEVDWLSVLNTDEVCLVVPLMVIDELDNKKNDPTSDRVRKRSRLIINKLRQYGNQTIRRKISLVVLQEGPNSTWFEQNGIDLSDNDKRIIGAAKWFHEQNPDFKVVTISDDYGFKLRSETVGIKCIEPDERLNRLTDEPDPQQKEIAQLKVELARYKNAAPQLSMGFMQDGEVVQS